jgi:hypothetical protein
LGFRHGQYVSAIRFGGRIICTGVSIRSWSAVEFIAVRDSVACVCRTKLESPRWTLRGHSHSAPAYPGLGLAVTQNAPAFVKTSPASNSFFLYTFTPTSSYFNLPRVHAFLPITAFSSLFAEDMEDFWQTEDQLRLKALSTFCIDRVMSIAALIAAFGRPSAFLMASQTHRRPRIR